MITKIGIVAGEIWQFLDQHGDTDVSKIIDKLDHPRDIILMSIGWLAREGHVVLTGEESNYKVSLRKKQEEV